MSFLDLTSTPVSSNEVLPNGVYLTKIANAEVKDTKSGAGQYISVQFKVIDGEHEGRSVFNQFNIKNDNPKAVQIGMESLKSMLFHAKAPLKLESPQDIIGYDVAIKVSTKSDDYGDKNIVKAYTTKEMYELNKGKSSDSIPF